MRVPASAQITLLFNELNWRRAVTTSRTLLCVSVALAFARGVDAQAPTPVSLPGTQQYDFVSAVNGHSYRLYIAPPEGHAANDTTRFPVLYLLDGARVLYARPATPR